MAEPEPQAPRSPKADASAWREAARMFNDPEISSSKAIEFMEENELVEPNPAGVARLFREKAGPPAQGGLDKKEIGEYLCKLKPYNTDVREAYLETFDFTGRTFVDSLREYLRSFRLPGESMLIERLFSSWAARFYRNNPQDFAPALLTPEKVEKFRQAFNTAVATSEQPSGAATAATPSQSSTLNNANSKNAAGGNTPQVVVQAGYLGFAPREQSSQPPPPQQQQQVRASMRSSKQAGKKKKAAKLKRYYFELRRSAEAGKVDTLVYLDKKGGKVKGTIMLSMCDAAMPGLEDGTRFDVSGRSEVGEEVQWQFKSDNEGASMAWVNLIMMSLTDHVASMADAAKKRLEESGTIAFSELVCYYSTTTTRAAIQNHAIE